MPAVPRLVLSAVRGGLGKTTLSLGIIGAWRKQGRSVAVFKKGPDFIDAGWLGAAAGVQCYNLDPFLMEEDAILRSFVSRTANAHCAVIEGNRGLYDGVDESGSYSTARLSKILKSPVLLIIDCTKSSSTAAAVALGCREFDRDVLLHGVILNNVASSRQESVIRKAVEQYTGIPVVGAVPRLARETFPERHMGLMPFHEHPDVIGSIAAATSIAEQYLDLAGIWRIADGALELTTNAYATISSGQIIDANKRPIIGVIRDRAFQFYYPDNLDALEQQGAVIKEVNALKDSELPQLDALYIGGGFPETQAAELAANESFCRSLKNAAEGGLPIYAECGGLIYLGRSLYAGGVRYPMTSVFPVDFQLEKRPQAHGYAVAEVSADNPFFEKGTVLKGHEFHYSRILNIGDIPKMIYTMKRGTGIDGKSDGIIYKNVLASYLHLHSAGTPSWAAGFIRAARVRRSGFGPEAG